MKLSILIFLTFASLSVHAKVQSHTCTIGVKKLVLNLDQENREISLNSRKVPTEKTFDFGMGGVESDFYKPLAGSLCGSLLVVDYNKDYFFIPINHDNATDGQRQALILLLKKSDFAVVSTQELPLTQEAIASEGKVFFAQSPILGGGVGQTVKIKGSEYLAMETKFPIWVEVYFDKSNKALVHHNLNLTYQKNKMALKDQSEEELKKLLKWNESDQRFEKKFVFKASAQGKPDCYGAAASQSLANLEWICSKE